MEILWEWFWSGKTEGGPLVPTLRTPGLRLREDLRINCREKLTLPALEAVGWIRERAKKESKGRDASDLLFLGPGPAFVTLGIVSIQSCPRRYLRGRANVFLWQSGAFSFLELYHALWWSRLDDQRDWVKESEQEADQGNCGSWIEAAQGWGLWGRSPGSKTRGQSWPHLRASQHLQELSSGLVSRDSHQTLTRCQDNWPQVLGAQMWP